MVVRIVLWSVGDAKASIEEILDRIDELEELPAPGLWLVNHAAERFGAVIAMEDGDDSLPPQLAELQALIGKPPEVYEDFDGI
jgi:hypothetical protein